MAGAPKHKDGRKAYIHADLEKKFNRLLVLTFFVLTVALYSVEPIMTVYVTQLSSNTRHVALFTGMVFSASGLANIIAAPRLGKLSDKIGAQKVILAALLVAGLIFIPQAFVKNPWQLMGLRFILGLAAAGLIPSVNILVKSLHPLPLQAEFLV